MWKRDRQTKRDTEIVSEGENGYESVEGKKIAEVELR